MQPEQRPSPVAVPGYYESDRAEVVALVPAAGARILDVGCAAGAMGQALKARGAREVVGVEIVAEMAAIARTRLDAVHELDIQRGAALPYPDGYFDVLTCADVLEHLVDPGQVLRHLRRYLRPDGTLVCSIPNVRHESVALRLLVEGRWHYEDYGILDRTHLRFYTLEEIHLLLREAGFILRGPVAALRSAPSPYLDRTAQLVRQLGGDVARFKDEATVIQYLLAATPVATSFGDAVGQAGDGWRDARPMRVLVAPRWDDTSDQWQAALPAFCAGIGAADPVTVGIVAPAVDWDRMPAGLVRLLSSSPADLRLLPRPTAEADWATLIAGARVLMVTGDDPALVARARQAGLEVLDGHPGESRRLMRILQVEAPNHGRQGDHVYRTLQPCRALGELPGVRVASGDLLSPAVHARLLTADVLVLCDVVDADLLPVIETRRRHGRPTVYEINDHFRAPQAWNPTAYLASNLLTRSLSAQLAARADAVQVTVPQLAHSFAGLHPRFVVLPNQLWQLPEVRPRASEGTVWLGWGGSLGHWQDLQWVMPSLRRALERHAHVKLAVMGPNSLLPLFDWVPPHRLRRVPGGSIDSYYRFVDGLDVGICPLLPTDFNRCRSDVKFLELAAHGVVAVCSDLAPYQDSVRDGETGLRFGSLEQLDLALDQVLNDPGLRGRLAGAARQWATGRLERAHTQARLGLYRELIAAAALQGQDGATSTETDETGDWPSTDEADPGTGSFPGSRYESLSGSEIERLLYQGMVQGRDGHGREAVRCFRDATRRSPSFYRTWLHLGSALPDPREAVRALREARRLAPWSPSAALALATRLEEADELVEAAQVLVQTRALSPWFGAAEARLAALAEKMGNGAEAVALYQAATEANPYFPEPAMRLALLALAGGQAPAAIALLERARSHDPELWMLDFLLGRALLESGQPEPARQQLERALELANERQGDRRPVLAQLARAYMALGNLEAARTALAQAQNPAA